MIKKSFYYFGQLQFKKNSSKLVGFNKMISAYNKPFKFMSYLDNVRYKSKI